MKPQPARVKKPGPRGSVVDASPAAPIERNTISKPDVGRSRENPCPKCGGRLVRRHRRLADRLISAVVPLRRYRCTSAQCRYEFTVPKTRATPRPSSFPRLMALTLATALIASVGWYLASKKETRSEVMEARRDQVEGPSPSQSTPQGQPPLMELRPKSPAILDEGSKTAPEDLKLEFIPTFPSPGPSAFGTESAGAR